MEAGSGEELILAYVAKTLESEREQEFERHLGLCGRCRDLAQAQSVVWSALDAWPSEVESPNFDARLSQRIAENQQARWFPRWLPVDWSWRPAVPVGVACAALMAAFLLKSPALIPEQPARNQPQLQIDQVEHALDDMDLLKQLGVEGASEKSHPPEKI